MPERATASTGAPAGDMRWWGWGDPAHATGLPDHLHGLLRDELGADPHRRRDPVGLEDVSLAPPRLGEGPKADLLRALGRGYAYADRDPTGSARDIVRAQPGLDPGLVRSELRTTIPIFFARGHRWGQLDAAALRAWAAWEARFGIVRRPPEVARAFDGALVPPGPS